MNKIARFEEFSQNEELFHGYTSKGEGGGIGSKTANKVFRKIGKFFGNSADILNDYLLSKVEDKVITQSEADEVYDMLEYSCRGKKGPEIQSMVDAKLEEMYGEFLGGETEE
jgi:uncharacterized protein YuzB (UPF0349 family)